MKNISTTIVNEVREVLDHVKETEMIQLAEAIQSAKRIFIAGTGRSGLVGKMFGMRLMHSEYPVFIVGETITPSLGSQDLLLVISGSGGTASLLQYAQKAKEIDAKVALVTTNPDSTIGQRSDVTVQIPAATKKRLASEPETIQPLGSSFDQSAHLLLDAIIVYLLETYPAARDEASLRQQHTNLE
ncbi:MULTISPECIES: 6-phospho-3-hexuloisomerase [Gracilibacillus]|uniref:6-phospho-3-hexuloisomerase n=1 Tax=Gracilibacillus TaxID=74385 RepID=UPI0008241597|nr:MULTISPECIES: 6-phospho-3-hexuloisomerase [Gracilibacillus]